MKAIVNVTSKSSNYKQYNGHTYDVRHLGSKCVTLDLGQNREVIFSLDEIILVDFATEYHKAIRSVEETGSSRWGLENLNAYKDNKGIIL